MNNLKETLLDTILPLVQRPGQYVGAEWNMVRKDPNAVALRMCLAFPDTYAVGMSHTGLQILYGLLNERRDVYAERVFAPWTDMQEALRSEKLPLCSLETFTPLREFDVIGFTLQYEMGYTNLLDMLELGGIPLLARDRTPDDPLVVAGGPCAFNTEPLVDFIDLFVLGDGENRAVDLAEACIELKGKKFSSREETLCFLVERVPNVYAPALYEEQDGVVTPRTDLPIAPPEKIEPAIVENLDSAYLPTRPIVPYVEVIHDRIAIEVMRGCSRGCRYCHAGMTRRPVRCRSVQIIVEAAEKQYAATGHSQIALTSLSTSDYPHLRELIGKLSRRFSDRKVSINLPSLRVSEQLTDLPLLIGNVRKPALTMAPEAATERLRRVINKNLSEDDLYRGIEAAYREGWQHVKLYFMVGLPTETDDDIVGIARMADAVAGLRKKVANAPARVNVSVATFVPKPHTPFEREPMISLKRMEEIRALLRSTIRRKSVRLKFHRPERSFLEGVFARGDRRLGAALLEAHRTGCRFDAWDEQFDFSRWIGVFSQTGIRPETYANRRREEDEPLPWSHLSAGVSETFLRRERERALRGEVTLDCRDSGCHDCGMAVCADKTNGVKSPNK